MRFFENGPSIPNGLLRASDQGELIFFCGAGVSMQYANLPSFNELLESVCELLKIDESSACYKQIDSYRKYRDNIQIKDYLSVDRIFNHIIKEFSKGAVQSAVAQSLKPSQPIPDVTAHKSLLKLSRQTDGKVRLITTNFDLLFESASKRLPSVCPTVLPDGRQVDEEWGIVHLHGAVTADYQRARNDTLVLSSSDFGDAYLAKGWAREFVNMAFTHYKSVFVGYAADDPPIRYFLEGLKSSGLHSERLFALHVADDENGAEAVKWEDKGVTPITFPTREALWETVEAWSVRAQNPDAWRKRILRMAAKGPRELKPFERGQVAELVSTEAGAIALASQKPKIPGEWLCVFDRNERYAEAEPTFDSSKAPKPAPFDLYCLDTDPEPDKLDNPYATAKIPKDAWHAFDITSEDSSTTSPSNLASVTEYNPDFGLHLRPRLQSLGRWISNNFDDPATAWWAFRQPYGLHWTIRREIRWKLDRLAASNKSMAINKAWSKIFFYHDRLSSANDRTFDAFTHSGRAINSKYSVFEFINSFAPQFEYNIFKRGFNPTGKSIRTWNEIVSLSLKYKENISSDVIPENYMGFATGLFRKNLEEAEMLEREISTSGRLYIETLTPVEIQGDFGTSDYGLSGYVRSYLKFFEKLKIISADAARKEMAEWPAGSEIFDRLRFWAGKQPELVYDNAVLPLISAITRETFWGYRSQRDLLLCLETRWQEMPEDHRNQICSIILAGPPRWQRETKKDHKERAAYSKAILLRWLELRGCLLPSTIEGRLARLIEAIPGWNDDHARRAAEGNEGRGGFVSVDPDPNPIAGEPLKKLIQIAARLKDERWGDLVEQRPFSGLSLSQPARALGAIRLEEDFKLKCWAWSQFLFAERNKDQPPISPRLRDFIARRLVAEELNVLAEILDAAARWLRSEGKQLEAANGELFEAIWCRLVSALGATEKASHSAIVHSTRRSRDWVTEAINSSAGILAELLVELPGFAKLNADDGLPEDWKRRYELLLATPDPARHYALVILAHQLNYIYYLYQAWATKHVLKHLDEATDADAIWAGYLWAARTPQIPLYQLLKPRLLEIAQGLSNENRQSEIIAGILLVGWRHGDGKKEELVSSSELRAVLIGGKEEFRRDTIRTLERWSLGDSEDSWRPIIPKFFEGVWPSQTHLKNSRISSDMFNMAISCVDNFEQVVDSISRYLVKVDDQGLFLAGLRKDEPISIILEKFPKKMLELLDLVLSDDQERWPYGAKNLVREIDRRHPEFRKSPQLIRVIRLALQD
ncbi:MAG: SIR2 family protein [Oceanicaulis sp.]|nr:SIR2 family protein [Oceanicaulis sp.]